MPKWYRAQLLAALRSQLVIFTHPYQVAATLREIAKLEAGFHG